MHVRLAALALLALPACDSDAISEFVEPADAGPKNVEVPLGDDATVGDLSEDDRRAVCRAFIAAVDNNVTPNGRCEIAGILGGGSAVGEGPGALVERCRDIATTCERLVTLGQQAAPSVPFDECGLFRGDTAACPVEIAALRGCLDEMASTTARAFEILDCPVLEEPEVPDLAEITPDVPDSRPCIELQRQCPGVFTGGGAADPDAGP